MLDKVRFGTSFPGWVKLCPILAVFALAVCDTVTYKKKSISGLVPVPGRAPETPGIPPRERTDNSIFCDDAEPAPLDHTGGT